MRTIVILLLLGIFSSCKDNTPLPILGFENHKIPDFEFMNQDSVLLTNESFSDKIYVADFFFINCPTICPKVKRQMLRIYDRYPDEKDLVLLSHTLDPKRDTILALRTFANNLEVTSDRWHFVTGKKEKIYDIVDDYFSVAIEDPDAPGGFDHSGNLLLVDKDRQVRAFCNGTSEESVTKFFKAIDKLLDEHKKSK